MYRRYLNRVAEKDLLMAEIWKEVRKGLEDMKRELREEMRSANKQEWSGKRKQAPLPMKPEQKTRQDNNRQGPDTEMRDLPPPREVVIERRKEKREGRREAAKGEKK